MIAVMTAFSGVFALGVCFSILGSIKLKLAEQLKIDDAKVGQLISALMFSSLVFVLLIGPLTDLLGFKLIALVGFAAGAICVWLLASATSYQASLVACLLLGGAAMCVNTVGNALGPLVLFGGKNNAAALNLLNVFFGMGAFITPLIVAALLKKLGYKSTVGLIGAILLIPIIYTVFGTFPAPPEGFKITQALGLLGRGGVWAGGLALFCYMSLEVTLAGFVTTYLKSHDLSDEKAGTALSGFWIALMLARLIAALTIPAQASVYVVPALALVAVISIAVMVGAKSVGIGVGATLLTGFVLGPIFPTLVGVTFNKTETSGSVFSLIFGIGLLGAILMPSLIGKYAAKMNIRQSLRILVGVAAALILLSAFLSFGIPDAKPAPALPPAAGAALSVPDSAPHATSGSWTQASIR
ncbi:MAG TPA: MFS transporter [Candidatus Hydrogenedentes bacterium]|nr:MFS transporter [Candidatus Hydrogenedentota bacterium]